MQELGKPAYVPCYHLCGNGCGIYSTRPESCRAFECFWLRGDMPGDERRRPDNLGVMLRAAQRWTADGKSENLLEVWEVMPGSRDLTAVHYLIGRLLKAAPPGTQLVWHPANLPVRLKYAIDATRWPDHVQYGNSIFPNCYERLGANEWLFVGPHATATDRELAYGFPSVDI